MDAPVDVVTTAGLDSDVEEILAEALCDPERPQRLLHVLDAVARIDRYCDTGRSSLEDDKTRDAVLRRLTVIGQALGAITDETHAHLRPSLPTFRNVSATPSCTRTGGSTSTSSGTPSGAAFPH